MRHKNRRIPAGPGGNKRLSPSRESVEFSGAKKVTEEFREFLLSATGLAALGTIADVVSLQGENRVLAAYGMQALAHSSNIGIAALMDPSSSWIGLRYR